MNLAAEDLASDARKSENAQIRKTALAEAERGQHMKQVPLPQFSLSATSFPVWHNYVRLLALESASGVAVFGEILCS